MRNKVYYNEIDPYAVRWLHNLMIEGMIAPGDVDTRSIEDVTPNDLSGYTQCHFFAGIGVWSYALRLAGWPDDRPVWTGSCPCQPFSQAGKGGGFADERHLWPAFFHLIQERRPVCVFGEQVASKDGLAWLDLVRTDLEVEEYAFGAQDICSAGVGAPHIRQRLYWVADADGGHARAEWQQRSRQHGQQPQDGSAVERLADSYGERFTGRREPDGSATQSQQQAPRRADAGGRGQDGGMGNANDGGGRRDARTVLGAEGSVEGGVRSVFDGTKPASTTREDSFCRFCGASIPHRIGEGRCPKCAHHNSELGNNNAGLAVGSLSDDGGRVVRVERSAFGETEPVRGFWSGADWISCRDGKWRPVEPGTFPLAHGITNRVGRLRACGNAVNARLTAEFIGAYLECMQ